MRKAHLNRTLQIKCTCGASMKKKRIVIDVHEKLHQDIKRIAAEQEQTMKDFLIELIIKQLLLYKQES